MKALTPFEREDEERYNEEYLPPRIKSKKNLLISLFFTIVTLPIWALGVAAKGISDSLLKADLAIDNWIGKHFAWEE